MLTRIKPAHRAGEVIHSGTTPAVPSGHVQLKLRARVADTRWPVAVSVCPRKRCQG